MKGWGAPLLLGIPLMLGGCGGEAPKPTKVPMPPVGKKAPPPAPAQATPPSPVEVKAVPPAITTYTYDPKGKPDPFKPLVVEKVETPSGKPKEAGEAISEGGTPLERMDLAQLKLVALIWNIPQPRAMVEDGTGNGYILSIGTPIGKNKGKIIRITSMGVVVTEKYEAAAGKFKNRDVTLKLYPD
jgi:type IV pilus assembly protein PilP